jgi:hypothetical protein
MNAAKPLRSVRNGSKLGLVINQIIAKTQNTIEIIRRTIRQESLEKKEVFS